MTVLHGKENPSKACSEPFDDRTLKYVQENHVSTIHVSDANCPRAVPGEGTTKDLMTRLKRFPRGGRFFTTNMYERLGDAITLPPPPPSRPGHRNTAKAAPKDIARDGHIITVPLGVRSTQFELLIGNQGGNRHRNILAMCCCQDRTRNGRAERLKELHNNGACKDDGLARENLENYVARLASAKFVFSFTGNGKACYRDIEAVVAGSVPILDGYFSGGVGGVFDDDHFPAVHVPMKNYFPALHLGNSYLSPTNITSEWLESEYRKLEARCPKLSVSKAFWPYWLYQVFLAGTDKKETSSATP